MTSRGTTRPAPCSELVDRVYAAVEKLSGVTRVAATSRLRHRRVVMARWLVIQVLRERTLMTKQELANAVGRTDHTTVIYALCCIGDLLRGIRRDEPVIDTVDGRCLTMGESVAWVKLELDEQDQTGALSGDVLKTNTNHKEIGS